MNTNQYNPNRGRFIRCVLALALCLAVMLGAMALADDPAPAENPEQVCPPHNLVQVEGNVDATCTQDGNIAYWQCSTCKAFFSDDKGNNQIGADSWVIPALGHDWVADPPVEATCTTEGYVPYHCSRCSETKKEITESALGHDWVADAAVEATCTAEGYVPYHCSRCSETKKEITEPALEHDWVADATVEATCTTEGYVPYHCSRCSETKKENTVSALGHAPGDAQIENDVAATCTAARHYDKVVYCTKCGAEISRETITDGDALGHDWDGGSVTTPATCSATGVKTFKCKRNCGETKTEEIPTDSTAHDVELQNAKEATCGEAGYTGDKVCKICHKTIKSGTTIPATGHTLTKHDKVEPTKDKEGTEAYWECTACHKLFSDDQGKSEIAAPVTIPKLVYYKVTFVDEDGKTVLKATAEYLENTPADQIVKPDDPKKEPDEDNIYTFAGWEPELAPVTADVTYKAVYTPESLTVTEAPYTYKLNPEKTEATIIKYDGTDTDLVIEDSFGDAKVVAIAADAFKGRKDLVSVVVPAGVKTIGDNAFADCENLTSLTLPDTLEAMTGQAQPLTLVSDPAQLTTLKLSCTQATTLMTADTFKHDVQVGDKTEQRQVQLPMAVTDIEVTKDNDTANPASLTVDCDFQVQAYHAITVESGGTLINNKTITNFGTVANSGVFTNNGSVLSCAGDVTGVSGGTVKTRNQHTFDANTKKCAVCNADPPKLSIAYTGKAPTKEYDKLYKAELNVHDFRIENTFGLDVSIKKINYAQYSQRDAGKCTVKVSLALEGADAGLYKSTKVVSIPATITPRTLTIKPKEGQKKVYGAADPKAYTGTVKGLLAEKVNGVRVNDKITGKLGREPGEDVGRYRITQNTLDAGGNYNIQVTEQYFTIEPKSINASDVGLVTIGNQRYTGQPVEPAISLRYGKRVLKEGVDFKVTFTDNVQPGVATVKLEGIGNYTGSRESAFRILNIASGVDTSSGGFSSGYYSYDGFDDGEYESTEDYDDYEEVDEDQGRLVIEGEDFGTILFNAAGKPASFVQIEEPVEIVEGEASSDWMLTIIPDPLADAETGETLMLDDESREQYDELHLRLSASLVESLADMGLTEIVYALDYAELHVPLSALPAEIPLDAANQTEVIDTMEPDEEFDEALEEGELEEATVEELEMELAPASMTVDVYDICLEQTEVARLTEREIGALADYEPLTPSYRVRVRAVANGDQSADMLGEDGDLVDLTLAEPLPEEAYPVGLVLRLIPLDELEEAPEDALAVFISEMQSETDPDVITAEPAEFTDVDGMLCVERTVDADGIYAVGTVGEEDDDAIEFEDDDFDLEDDDLGSFGDLSGMGQSFSLDDNGNPVLDN